MFASTTLFLMLAFGLVRFYACNMGLVGVCGGGIGVWEAHRESVSSVWRNEWMHGKHAHEYHLHVLDRRRRHHGADFRQVLHLCSENPFERIHARVVCAFVCVCVCVCVCVLGQRKQMCVYVCWAEMPQSIVCRCLMQCIQASTCIAYRHVSALHTGM